MTHYKNWFHELHVLEQPGYVETGDDTVHQIQHVENVPLATHDGQFKHMANVWLMCYMYQQLQRILCLFVKW